MHIDEGALEKVYDDQVSKLFDVLCTTPYQVAKNASAAA